MLFFKLICPCQETVNGTLQYVSNSTLKPVEVSHKQTCNASTFHQVFTFTSIISAVDPVAVLAIFSEVTRSPSFFSPFVDSGRGESGPLLHGLWGVPNQRWSRCGRSTNYNFKPPSGFPQNIIFRQVLYKMMNSFAGIMSVGETVTLTNCLMGLLSFCTIALGGLVIGGCEFVLFGNSLSSCRNCCRRCDCPHH